MNNRFGFVPILLVLFSVVAFFAGYLTYPFLHKTPALATPNLEVFWEAWNLLDQNFLGSKPDDQSRSYGATRGMVESFGDPYTVFVEPQPQELQDDNLRGKFGGIGAQIEQTEIGFILHPIPEQPAANAGILDGDRLLQVDDSEIMAQMTSDDVVALVRGEVKTEVALLVRRTITTTNPLSTNPLSKTATLSQTESLTETNSTQDLAFKVMRAELELPSIQWQILLTKTVETDQPIKIGYMHQSLFSERSPEEMTKALAAMRQEGVDRFIWDLRGNPGGRVDSATQLADIWLDSGVIVREEHADGSKEAIEAKRGGDAIDLPLVLIVDGGSASAAEIVAGAMQDNGRAKLVGGQTFGKGSVQLLYTLTDGSSLHVTNAQWLTPNGNQISGKGLTPDLLVAAETDPVLIAIDTLLKDE